MPVETWLAELYGWDTNDPSIDSIFGRFLTVWVYFLQRLIVRGNHANDGPIDISTFMSCELFVSKFFVVVSSLRSMAWFCRRSRPGDESDV